MTIWKKYNNIQNIAMVMVVLKVDLKLFCLAYNDNHNREQPKKDSDSKPCKSSSINVLLESTKLTFRRHNENRNTW